MTNHLRLQIVQSVPDLAHLSWLQAATARFCAWVESYADAYATAALYGELARLSDAELRRRGLARETLARDVSEIGRTKRRPADAAE